ncbi:MAG: multiheme c-type cytochrome, partial [Deferrisomatales bacterium]
QRVECLECHVTGFGEWGGWGGAGGIDLAGVQCEACHGPGSLHPAAKISRAGAAAEKACRQCHTRSRSPQFKLKDYLPRVPCVALAARGGARPALGRPE